MFTLYAVCAAVGGTIFVCQFILTILGLADADHDVGHGGGEGFDVDHAGGFDADHGGDAVAADHGDAAGAHDHADHSHAHGANWLFGVLTFRSVVAATTFFGLAGLAGSASELRSTSTLIVALAAGLAALYGVAQMMRGLHKLRAEGTVRIQHAVGQPAEVYLTVPGHRTGAGKITVKVQNRTMEYQAVTDDETLPTGTPVVVADVIGPDTVEVHLASDDGSDDHA